MWMSRELSTCAPPEAAVVKCGGPAPDRRAARLSLGRSHAIVQTRGDTEWGSSWCVALLSMLCFSCFLARWGCLCRLRSPRRKRAVPTAYAVPTRAEEVTATVIDVKTFTLARPAEHVAAYWQGRENARVTLAFSTDGANFGPPVDAGRDDAGDGRQNGLTYGAVLAADGAIAVRVTTDAPLASLTVIGMSSGGGVATRSASAETRTAAAGDQPTIISRAAWGASSAYLNWAPEFYPAGKLIVHHTAENISVNGTPDYYARLVRSIYYYHAVTRDWGDIAYNFLIDPLGNVYEGRYSDNDSTSPAGEDSYGNGVIGGHAQGYNTGTIGIALLGTYSSQNISTAARASLERLLAWSAKKNGIDPTGSDPYHNPFNASSTIQTWNIAGHRDYRSTDCPGTKLYGALPAIRQTVLNLTGPVTKPTPSPTYLKISVSPSSPSADQQVTITATLIEQSSRRPLPSRTITFVGSGIATGQASLGAAVTDSSGVASVQTKLTAAGMRWVAARLRPRRRHDSSRLDDDHPSRCGSRRPLGDRGQRLGAALLECDCGSERLQRLPRRRQGQLRAGHLDRLSGHRPRQRRHLLLPGYGHC